MILLVFSRFCCLFVVGVFSVAGRSLRRKLRYRFARARARARDLTDSGDSDERRLDSIDCRLARPRKSLEFTWGSSNCIQTYQLRRVPSDSTLLCQREANSGGLLRRPSPECTGPAPLRGTLLQTIFSCFLRGAPTPVLTLPMVGRGGRRRGGHISATTASWGKLLVSWCPRW